MTCTEARRPFLVRAPVEFLFREDPCRPACCSPILGRRFRTVGHSLGVLFAVNAMAFTVDGFVGMGPLQTVDAGKTPFSAGCIARFYPHLSTYFVLSSACSENLGRSGAAGKTYIGIAIGDCSEAAAETEDGITARRRTGCGRAAEFA